VDIPAEADHDLFDGMDPDVGSDAVLKATVAHLLRRAVERTPAD
jgi:hypothetical protein